MPVFHTKTIESILEPVAQQVSKLVILHEEAEDGNAMPDLAKPVQAVKIAVDNLVRVGHDTCNNSEDLILKQDMPPALHRVEEASYLLLDASEMLRADPYSAPARKKLIEGSRGILQGTSGLLLAFDESEVRKIIRICKNVLEYLAITEVVETMEDLVTFVKNLSPVLTKMTKEVDAREKELTHQVHRDMLIRSLERVKQLTPVLISGVKIYIGTKEQGGHGLPDAQHNRDYVVHEMSNEIHEIIRVLQLTTYDEDEWDADDITVMKKALNALEGKMKQAQDWLMDPNGLIGGAGERSIRMILEDAAKAADRCADPRERDEILRVVGDLTSMVDALAELRQAGQGDSPQAQSLARGIQQKLGELQQKVAGAITNTERSGLRRPAHTVAGKVDQAQRWLSNPGVNDMGLGEQAARLVTDEGRRIAETLPAAQRADMLRLCDDTERLTNQLAEMCRRGMANTPQARALAGQLSHKLHQLKGGIQDALVDQVADDFMDIGTPLKLMSDAANAPFGAPNRDAIFEDRAVRFENHAHHLAQTAQMVAAAGGSSNRKTIEGIFGSVNQVNDLAPEIVRAARIVLMNPQNQAATEHFDMLKRQWTEQMEKLRGLVDDAIDTAAFIKATESGILKDTEQTEQAIRSVDPPGVVNNTSSIARRANRVLQVAQQEADNSEDPHFVDRVNNTIRELRSTITPMVQNAKGVAQNVTDPMAAQKWRGANQQLIDAVGNVRQAVTPARPDYPAGMMDDFPAPPDLSQLHISDKVDPVQAAPYRSSPVIKFQHRHSPVPAQLVRSTAVPVQVSRLKSESPVPAHSAPRHQGSPYGYGRDSPYDMAGQYMPAHTPPARQRGRGSPRDAFFSDTDQSYYSEPELIPQHGFGQNQANRGYHSPFHSAGQSHAKSGQAGMPYGVTPTLDIDLDELMKSAEKTKKSLQDATRVPPDVPPPPSDYHIQASQATGEYSSAPPVPPPPASYDYYNDQSSEYSYDSAPPRPPPPSGSTVPPRPPPPESEDEDDTHFPTPQANQPIMMAAHALHMDVKQWSSRDNEIIGAAKRMALLMAKLSQLVRGEGGKKELIDTAKAIAEASEEVARLAMNLAKECTDKRMRTSLLQVCERIPTIGTQLKILSTVKATMLGAQEPVPSPDGSEINCGSEEDEEATEMLIGNAQNLMQSVSSTVRAAQAASIKIRVDSGYQIRWLRKKPWYQ